MTTTYVVVEIPRGIADGFPPSKKKGWRVIHVTNSRAEANALERGTTKREVVTRTKARKGGFGDWTVDKWQEYKRMEEEGE